VFDFSSRTILKARWRSWPPLADLSPPISKGVNTYWEIFTTAEGKAAAIFQQTGFEERETDMGSED
jgi:hypothetical protein